MKKTISMAIALMLACSSIYGLASCGGVKPSPDTTADLEIFYWEAGNGSVWLDKTIEAFSAKYPEVNFVKRYSSSNDTWGRTGRSREKGGQAREGY